MRRAMHIILGGEEEPDGLDISSFGVSLTHRGADT
jgi:hypothetical protein